MAQARRTAPGSARPVPSRQGLGLHVPPDGSAAACADDRARSGTPLPRPPQSDPVIPGGVHDDLVRGHGVGE